MGSTSSIPSTRSAVTNGPRNSENNVHAIHSGKTDCKILSNIKKNDRKSDTGELNPENNSDDDHYIDKISDNNLYEENGTIIDSDDEEQTFESRRQQILDSLKNRIKISKSFESIIDENGEIRKEVSNLMHVIDISSDLPYRDIAKSQDIASYRIEICNILTENKIANLIFNVIDHIYIRWKDKSNTSVDADTFEPLYRDLGSLQNITDGSETFCVTVCMVPGFLKRMKTILNELGYSLLNSHEEDDRYYICRCAIGIINNVTMRDSCVTLVRHIDFTDVIKPLLQSDRNIVKVDSLSILAAIIEDKDIAIISANKEIVHLLVDEFKSGLDSTMRRSSERLIACTEYAIVIRRLAGNDVNKKVLVEAGCLELLVKFGKTAVDDTERIESVRAIWAFAFDRDIRKAMVSNKELGVVDLLLELKESENKKIKENCAGALWTIRKEQKISNTDKTTKHVNNANDGHIMISYQWADQITVIQIRDRLEKAGFKVWIDINEMKGSIPTAMASAVENASVFLMCMSQKYQNSLNCQSEADYAYQLQKTIMPLKLERDYKPRSWTGIFCGGKKFYEFTGKYNFDTKLKELLRDLAKSKSDNGQLKDLAHHPLSRVPEDVTDSVPVAMATPISYSGQVSDVTIDTIRDWTETDVQTWIDRKNLKSCGFNKRTGEEIALLIKMSIECPEYFYRCLETMWKIKDTLKLAKIVWALNDLKKELDQQNTG